MSVTSWFLVSSSGTRHRLPREMIFVGREDCELMLQSRSVDKQHAVINYDVSMDEHLVKDLGSLNGTFVNDLRIPDQTYISLKLSDVIRFGYDSHIYILERSQHKVPEEALKHEKYTSQLQLSQETPEPKKRTHTDERHVKPDKTERKNITDPSISRPTPLYGQPSWWGDDDEDIKGQRRDPNGHEHHSENQKEGFGCDVNTSPEELQDGQGKSIYSYRKEPSYFEIPTKEIQSKPETEALEVQEIPTKDTDNKAPPTPPVVQGHASFTIEFDQQTPGKMKIKDHVSKLSVRQRKNPGKESIATLPEVMSVENRVSDWLVQSDKSMLGNQDVQSVSEDHYNKTFKDELEGPGETNLSGTRRIVPPHSANPPEEHDYPDNYTPESKSQEKQDPQQAFVIEFCDDSQRKKRSQSFTNNISSPDFQSVIKNKLDKRKGTNTSTGYNPPTQQFTIPLKGSDGSQRAGSLRREKSEIRMSSTNFSSRSTGKPFGSVGRRSTLAQDFANELKRISKTASASTCNHNSSESNLNATSANGDSPLTNRSLPTTSHSNYHYLNQSLSTSLNQPSTPPKTSSVHMEDDSIDVKAGGPKQQEEEDSLSDAGTYTIEAEGPDKDIVEARSMIDQVFGVADSSQTSTFKPIAGHTEGNHSLLNENSSSPKLGQTDHNDTAKSPVQIQSMRSLTPGGTRWVSRWASLADSYTDSDPASTQVDLTTRVMPNRSTEVIQFTRGRRVLPPVPSDKFETPPPAILVQSDSFMTERTSEVQKQRWDPQRLSVQDDVDPDSLSDGSKSDDGSVVEQYEYSPLRTGGKRSYKTLANEDEATKDQDSSPKFSTATVTRQNAKLSKNILSPPNIDDQSKVPSDGTENSISLFRQESYTKERPSNDIPLSRLPHISSQASINEGETLEAFKGVTGQDTQSYLKDTEDVLAVLEAKFMEQRQGVNVRTNPEDSPSEESDVDTSSTVSGKNAYNSVPRKPVVLRGLLRDKSAPKTSEDSLSKKNQSSVKDDSDKADPSKRFQLRRNLTSLDIGLGHQSSPAPLRSDTVSDQESSSLPYKNYAVPFQRENLSNSKSKVSQALARSNSLSAPRPTRASVLRRARLGEASDNEGTETDRMSQNSDSNPSANKVTLENKKLSRLDILALPRKRTGSFATPSDTESSAGRTGFSNRSTESSNTVRKASVPDPKALIRKTSAPPNRQPIVRGRSSSAKYASSTARAQQNPKIHPPGPVRAVPRQRDSEGEGHESDAFHNWTSHSAEIARLSQDLAKDLAILAREIHDVAGDTESQNAPVETMAPAISAHEELRHQIPETILNFPKESSGSVLSDEAVRNQDLRQQSLRQDEVSLSDVMLNPVTQVSLAIRENTEELTEKIKALFHDKTDILEEIDARVNAADDSPPFKTPNKEVASILKELRRVQRQLEVINTIMDPRGNPDLSKTFPTALSSPAVVRSSRSSLRDLRSSQRGGGPTPSARRTFISSDRNGSVV
ncbi:centrosomal protein of 170 kDa protein B isoform X3 [Triplophysa dalaica]|uniref:centrosomal protein of 170 kDa protein B isoform X3 n=1 Tax=Triplophysa dalaica TaxID=1582913 RepID=UPI0024DFA451|nr:centrosomal protein of 170 kDa protein B isoform X3 [Triplophysa dalaica]